MRAISLALAFTLLVITLSAAPALPASAQAQRGFSFTLPPSFLAGCWFFGVNFDAAQGQRVVVQWSENTNGTIPVSLDFYIVPEVVFQQPWLCDDGPVNTYSADGAFGTANWAAPSGDGYTALVVNYGYYPVSGMIFVSAPNATLSASPVGPYLVRRGACVSVGCIGG